MVVRFGEQRRSRMVRVEGLGRLAQTLREAALRVEVDGEHGDLAQLGQGGLAPGSNHTKLPGAS